MRPTRPAAVAGTFYPSDPGQLAAMVDNFLAGAGREATGHRPRALIVPHAGYVRGTRANLEPTGPAPEGPCS